MPHYPKAAQSRRSSSRTSKATAQRSSINWVDRSEQPLSRELPPWVPGVIPDALQEFLEVGTLWIVRKCGTIMKNTQNEPFQHAGLQRLIAGGYYYPHPNSVANNTAIVIPGQLAVFSGMIRCDELGSRSSLAIISAIRPTFIINGQRYVCGDIGTVNENRLIVPIDLFVPSTSNP